ncbi:GOLPH3/VPS74 family protein [Streptacidiphilus griseoplanus]|uniref:GOLPH3/VPS74 family protein n=1 Tax=Peterkaempfera griseoplana TaxID=66896 RepID=UPI0006E2C973|nr:GPP34 family phosphoprotein [Peterkaempfera griseoplana]
MYDHPPVTLPEELLLLCADPESGQLRRPHHFNRALGGAVLAELLTAGALTVQGRSITEVRPLPVGDPVADRVLAELAATGKRPRHLGLERWVRRASARVDRAYLDALTARGLLTVRRRRILGILPATTYTATLPGWPKAGADRILRALSATGPAGPSDRDLQLAALAGTVGLDRRLFRGPDGRPTRRRIHELARATPIAAAVRRVISSDEAAASS